MRKTAFALSFALSVLLIASAGAYAQKRFLQNTEWRLVEADGRRVTNTAATISFNGDADRFTGNTGCNTMSGTVEVRGRNIDFGPARTTRRACKLMAGNVAESVVLDGLQRTRRYEVSGNTLRLNDRRGRTLLRYITVVYEAPGDSSRLDDRKWILEQIKGRQTFVALPYAFINFDSKKMSAGGDTSCNVFGGDYTVNGDRLIIRNVISTMRACVEDNSKMSTEREIMQALRDTNRYEIRNNRLSLYRGNELLLTFRGERK